MGTVGRRTLGSKSRSWLGVVSLVSWAALLTGACSGSKTTDPGPAHGGDPAGGQPDGNDPGPVVSGGVSGEAHGGKNPGGAAAGGIVSAGATNVAGSSGGLGGRASGGSGGADGNPPGIVGSRLGRACVKDSECQTANETGLTCITETSTVLGNGAPPHGLCSRPCATDDECAAHSAGSICYAMRSSSSYCVEGCEIGSPELGEAKCHSRPELVCAPALLASTGDICTDNYDCQPDELCQDDGTCHVVFSACLPSCRGDVDCAVGMYCDQSFLSGLCRSSKPTGKRLGEPCTVPAANQPEEPDGCLGFCQADSDVGTQGHCAATCGLGRECAWDAASQRFDGLCLYASALTVDTGAEGDFGFCTPSCNCSEQCNDPALSCQLLASGALDASFKGQGLCFATDATSTPVEDCASGGAGGGGASSAGGAGAAGTAGSP